MKLKRVSSLGVLFFLALSGAALAGPPSVIEPTVERHQGPPLWISAGAVANKEKVIDLDLIDSLTLSRNVEKQRQALQKGPRVEKLREGEEPLVADILLSECNSMLDVWDHRGGELPSSSLTDLAEHSRSIVLGTIVTVERGFSSGAPSSLLEVEVKEVIKGHVPGNLIYVDYLVARFRIGPYSFCNLNKGFEPSSGDQLLLFDYIGPVDREGNYYAPRLEQLLFQGKTGRFFFSPKLKADPELEDLHALDQVVRKLRSATGRVPNLKGHA